MHSGAGKPPSSSSGEGEESVKDPSLLIELRIVQAGARADAGQQAEALRLLANEIESPRGVVPKPAQARLRYAYAALLLEQATRRRPRTGSWWPPGSTLKVRTHSIVSTS